MNKCRILLIEPSESWVTNNPRLKHVEQVMLPLGLMYLSAYLKSKLKNRVEIKIISTIVDLSHPGDIKDIIHTFRPHIIGIRSVLFYMKVVNQIIRVSRTTSPDSLIIIGGPNVSPNNPGLMENQGIDIFVAGEGEEPLYRIVKYYLNRGKQGLTQHLSRINGVIYRENGKLTAAAGWKPLMDLDQLPIPDYSAVRLEEYRRFLNYGYNRRPMGVLFTSRGCPYKCIYCHNTFGKSFRARSAGAIYQEIKTLHQSYHIKDFCIIDDNFSMDRKRLEEFTRILVNNGPKVKLYFPNGIRADSLTLPLLDQLIKAGTIWLTFNIETAVPRLQKLIKKHVNINKLKEIVTYSCRRNIITNLSTMVGFPTETIEEAKYSLQFAAQFDKILLPYYFSVKYYPGTQLAAMAKNYGIELDEQAQMNPYHGSQFQETPLITKKDFQQLNYWYLRNIFLNPQRIKNSITILKQHFSTAEINDMFTLFFRRPIKDLQTDLFNPLEIRT